MNKALTDFLFGLCFGVGFELAAGICRIIGMLFNSAGLR